MVPAPCGASHAASPDAVPAPFPRPAHRPGGEQQAWVQSQTTFAVLHREEDGSYAVRSLKQKIWVEGVSYELQVGVAATSGAGRTESAGWPALGGKRIGPAGGRAGAARPTCGSGTWCGVQTDPVPRTVWLLSRVPAPLQEIYGLEQSVAAARGSPADDPDNEERLCVICLVNERDTTVLPCRHM
mgnify:CR=1 FL=1